MPELPYQGTCSGWQLNPPKGSGVGRDQRAEGRSPELGFDSVVFQEQQSEFGLPIFDTGHGSAQGSVGYCAGASSQYFPWMERHCPSDK